MHGVTRHESLGLVLRGAPARKPGVPGESPGAPTPCCDVTVKVSQYRRRNKQAADRTYGLGTAEEGRVLTEFMVSGVEIGVPDFRQPSRGPMSQDPCPP